ncbi:MULTISPECIES: hypothetical protein [unclassified Streptomyces]|uniref:hypothetical protein n=1 Tax=unclassified Streptomyces TaxID=2593676 RepID=UPI00364A8534
MATPNPTGAPRTAAPAIGTRTSVRVDQALSDDLAVLMRPGVNASDAIRAAVGQLANVYRTAWHHGVCPSDTAPRILAYQLYGQATTTPATSAYDVRQPAPGVSPHLPEPPYGAHVAA